VTNVTKCRPHTLRMGTMCGLGKYPPKSVSGLKKGGGTGTPPYICVPSGHEDLYEGVVLSITGVQIECLITNYPRIRSEILNYLFNTCALFCVRVWHENNYS